MPPSGYDAPQDAVDQTLTDKLRRAEQQRKAVAELKKLGANVAYDFEFSETGYATWATEPPAPKGLRWLLGDDMFADVYRVVFDAQTSPEDLVHLKSLPTLEFVFLGDTHIGDDALVHLSNLRKLRLLDLENTEVSGRGLQHLRDLPKLEVLILRGTRVCGADVKDLTGLRSLKSLALSNTNLSEQDKNAIREAFPGTYVSFGTPRSSQSVLPPEYSVPPDIVHRIPGTRTEIGMKFRKNSGDTNRY